MIAASPATGVNAINGEGLAAAVAGVQVVVVNRRARGTP